MSQETLLKYCTHCIGRWACNMCGMPITSHSKVVRTFVVDGEHQNRWFCTRRCFKDFLGEFAARKKHEDT